MFSEQHMRDAAVCIGDGFYWSNLAFATPCVMQTESARLSALLFTLFIFEGAPNTDGRGAYSVSRQHRFDQKQSPPLEGVARRRYQLPARDTTDTAIQQKIFSSSCKIDWPGVAVGGA